MYRMMSGRYDWIVASFLGYKKTAISLVSFVDGALESFSSRDDLGIYYFVPKLAVFFNISIDRAINVFFYGIIALSLFISFVAFFVYYKRFYSRIFAAICLSFLSVVLVSVQDFFIFYALVLIVAVPVFLYLFSKKRSLVSILFFIFALGILAGYSNFCRSYSGVSALIFVVIRLIMYKYLNKKRKVLVILVLYASFFIPKLHTDFIFTEREKFLVKNDITFVKDSYESHPFWHTVICGLGYLSNPYGFKWNDTTADLMAKEIDPHVNIGISEEYEAACRKCFLKANWWFVLETIFAKLGIFLLYMFMFLNIGFLYMFFYRKPHKVKIFSHLSFLGPLAFSSIFGLLAMPTFAYSLGFITVLMLWLLVCVCDVFEFDKISHQNIFLTILAVMLLFAIFGKLKFDLFCFVYLKKFVLGLLVFAVLSYCVFRIVGIKRSKLNKS